MTEAVRVHFRDAALFAQPLEDRTHRAAVQVTAAAGSQKQEPRSVSSERAYIVYQRLSRSPAEGDHPLLVPLSVPDQQSLGGNSPGSSVRPRRSTARMRSLSVSA